MFIYNGLSEGDTAIKFLNNNSKIKLIDVSKGLEIGNNEEELWLNPSNYLMIAQNLKNDLSEYINSTVILQNIDTNYEKLKLTISTYDAQLNTVAENAKDKNIIVTNDTFKFLERYGFTVYSLEESENYSSAAYNSALTLANEKRISYIFMLEGDQESEKVKKLKDLGLNIVTIQRLGNLSDEDRNNDVNYVSVMDEFIESLKQEVY
jgi:zinc transport system substrate-binding protein